MKTKKPTEAWLRKWHAEIVRQCGTDDIAVLIAAVGLYRQFQHFTQAAEQFNKVALPLFQKER